jgi:hypothetical protein
MTRRPFDRMRFFVRQRLFAALALLGWYFRQRPAVAGGYVVALGFANRIVTLPKDSNMRFTSPAAGTSRALGSLGTLLNTRGVTFPAKSAEKESDRYSILA